jgi:hypothetical protein
MKVVSYLKSVPARNSNKQKELLLRKFAVGVNVAGDTGIVHERDSIVDCDVGVIQGWVYADRTPSHLKLRSNVINTQMSKKKYVATADANLFLYHNKVNPHGYLRYSFNGVFPIPGIYCDNNPDPERWKQISKDTGIVLHDYVRKGTHIVLCCQRNGGWSMGTETIPNWIVNTVKEIQKYSDRTIVIRAHPGDKRAMEYLRNPQITNLNNTKISINTPLETDLHKAWAVVNHNSSSIVGPLIHGYYGFVTDPSNSQCKEVTQHNLSEIENPKEFDRQKWLERISMFHWKFSELDDGSCWRHMRNYCQ